MPGSWTLPAPHICLLMQPRSGRLPAHAAAALPLVQTRHVETTWAQPEIGGISRSVYSIFAAHFQTAVTYAWHETDSCILAFAVHQCACLRGSHAQQDVSSHQQCSTRWLLTTCQNTTSAHAVRQWD